ncbi:MAG: family 10 glycosylhydrolase [Candidatus Aminicenantales bacterium]
MNTRAIAFLLLLLGAFPALAGSQTAGEESLAMPVRGVWMHPGFFGPDKTAALEKIRVTLDEYQKAGINTVIILVKDTSGRVYFKSRIGVGDPRWDWDFLAEFLAEARRRNMQVHAWFCVFQETSFLGRVREHPEWLIQSPRKELVGSVNPALPAVRDYERSLMMEVASRYGVDWIHLDYIRFPCEPTEPYFSNDAETLRLFQEYSGVDLGTLKARDSGNMIWNEWLEWNRGRVTQFVRELRESLKATGRPVKISAAVFPNADNARVLIGQDWAAWAKEGLVDMLCPMLYTNHARFFEKFARQAVEYGRGLCQVCPGIGIGTSHNQNTPEGMIEQMKISKSLGAEGVIFFSTNSLNEPFLEKLKSVK